MITDSYDNCICGAGINLYNKQLWKLLKFILLVNCYCCYGWVITMMLYTFEFLQMPTTSQNQKFTNRNIAELRTINNNGSKLMIWP